MLSTALLILCVGDEIWYQETGTDKSKQVLFVGPLPHQNRPNRCRPAMTAICEILSLSLSSPNTHTHTHSRFISFLSFLPSVGSLVLWRFCHLPSSSVHRRHKHRRRSASFSAVSRELAATLAPRHIALTPLSQVVWNHNSLQPNLTDLLKSHSVAACVSSSPVNVARQCALEQTRQVPNLFFHRY